MNRRISTWAGPDSRLTRASSRAGRPRRPLLERLEGRTLLSYGGSPDLDFGTGGVKATPQVGTFPGYSNASVGQPDGKLVVVGSSSSFAGNAWTDTWIVSRYTADGVPDPSFGDGGISMLPVSATTPAGELGAHMATIEAVGLQPDGKIVVAGDIEVADDSGSSAGTVAMVARLNPDGSVDTGFGEGGIVTLGTVGAGDTLLDYVRAVVVLADGTIIVSGSSLPTADLDSAVVEGLNPDGSIDVNFGTGGRVVLPSPAGTTMPIEPGLPGFAPLVAQPDGQFDVATNANFDDGSGSTEVVVTQLGADGRLDPNFGTGGQTVVTPRSVLSTAQSVMDESLAIQPDGKLIVGGSVCYPDSPTTIRRQLLTVRLTASGVLDPAFGIDGVDILTGITPADSPAGAIAVQPDGKIVLGDRNNFVFARLDVDGLPDDTFGTGGTVILTIPTAISDAGSVGLEIEPDGKILSTQSLQSQVLIRLLGQGAPGDYNHDGISDPSILMTEYSIFGALYFDGVGGAGELEQFGLPGAGQTLPASGAYDGGGISEPAVYLPAVATFAVRPYAGGPDVITPFGTPGLGNSLPAPGDYDESGRTEVGVYLPGSGIYAYRPASGGPDVDLAIGLKGAGRSIPAPADYFNTGQDDVAVFEPATATFVIRNPVNGVVSSIPFGIPGAGRSIPAPGDYDGSGHADLAVYLPGLAELVYRPAGGGPDVFVPFDVPGASSLIPAPGDYDGSGKTEVAGYDPATGVFSYLPAVGGSVVSTPFGAPGSTIPFSAASDSIGFNSPGSGFVVRSIPTADSVSVPITPDVLDTLTAKGTKKPPGLV